MSDWMPAVDQDAMRSAIARKKTWAEKDQAAMLEPINRYKTPIGRASTPEMREAIQRRLSASSGELS